MTDFVLAIDGGGSKTDVVALALDGTVLGSGRGAGSNPQVIGLASSLQVVSTAARAAVEAARAAGGGTLLRTHLYLSGLDLAAEIETYRAAIADCAWAGTEPVLDNDLFALLRAGTSAPDAAAVVCGTGINAVAVRADGETARFAALGMISGDWGGGSGLGEQALWHAARSADGRGIRTILEELVPAALGQASVSALIEEFHFGRLAMSEINVLVRPLFEAAASGDSAAMSIVARQAEEIVTMARVALDRLGLLEVAVPIVLGGGVLAAEHPLLIDAVVDGLRTHAPLAHIELVRHAPIVGAALLALEHAGATTAAVVAAETTVMRQAQS
ncbi:MAG: N-acetylglucosamine kinase [Microbacteriaceae bacterium]